MDRNSNSNFHDDDHEQNDNWEWNDAFTAYIDAHVVGTSLKVCSGLRPIADVNLDLKDLRTVADADTAGFTTTTLDYPDHCPPPLHDALIEEAIPSPRPNSSIDPSNTPATQPDPIYARIHAKNPADSDLYDGVACYGDMFDIPFEANTFDTVISDPPWLQIGEDERKTLFEEVLRVCKPGGRILYNATWIPQAAIAHEEKVRRRQQLDFWGGPSFALFYHRQPRDIHELPDLADPLADDGLHHRVLVDDDDATDPRLVNELNATFRCTYCGCTQLVHTDAPSEDADTFHNPFRPPDWDDPDLYMCAHCSEYVTLYAVYQQAAEIRDTPVEWHYPPAYVPDTVTADDITQDAPATVQTNLDVWIAPHKTRRNPPALTTHNVPPHIWERWHQAKPTKAPLFPRQYINDDTLLSPTPHNDAQDTDTTTNTNTTPQSTASPTTNPSF